MRASFGFTLLFVAVCSGLAFAQINPRPLPNTRVPANVIHQRIPPLLPAPRPDCGYADCDGDGHSSAARGGDDCDDFDPNRYPGKPEVADDKDDDCDAATFGYRDQDNDGAIDQAIFNVGADGRHYGGDDCDDRQAGIRPTAQELPNHIDDNCDGLTDNLLGTWYTPVATH